MVVGVSWGYEARFLGGEEGGKFQNYLGTVVCKFLPTGPAAGQGGGGGVLVLVGVPARHHGGEHEVGLAELDHGWRFDAVAAFKFPGEDIGRRGEVVVGEGDNSEAVFTLPGVSMNVFLT